MAKVRRWEIGAALFAVIFALGLIRFNHARHEVVGPIKLNNYHFESKFLSREVTSFASIGTVFSVLSSELQVDEKWLGGIDMPQNGMTLRPLIENQLNARPSPVLKKNYHFPSRKVNVPKNHALEIRVTCRQINCDGVAHFTNGLGQKHEIVFHAQVYKDFALKLIDKTTNKVLETKKIPLKDLS